MIRPHWPLRIVAFALVWHCTMAATSAAAIVQAAPAGQQPIDPEIETAVHRYFATQEAEDADGYLALWSESRRPRRENLQYIFDAGDDRFAEVTIRRVTTTASETRVRVSAMRTRTSRGRNGAESTVRSLMQVSLVFERGVGGWRLVRETPPADDLAAALLEATTAEDRTRLLSQEPDLVNKSLVDAIARRGTEFIQQQQYQRAQAVYEQVLAIAQRIDDQKAIGEALQNLANASYFQRNFPRALELYEQRLDVERRRQDDEGIAAALVGIATIRYSYAEYDAALDRYREALAIQDALPDRTGAATTLVSTGNVLYLLGDYAAAIADYRRSRDIFHGLNDTRGEADTLGGLGRVYVAQGDYGAALTAFTGVLDEGRARSNRSQQGIALLSIGDVQFRLGNLDAARAALDESRGHFDAVSDPSNAGRARQGMALVDLVAGRFTFAEDQVPPEHYRLLGWRRSRLRRCGPRRAGIRAVLPGQICGRCRLLRRRHQGVHGAQPDRSGGSGRGGALAGADGTEEIRGGPRRGRPRAALRSRPLARRRAVAGPSRGGPCLRTVRLRGACDRLGACGDLRRRRDA